VPVDAPFNETVAFRIIIAPSEVSGFVSRTFTRFSLLRNTDYKVRFFATNLAGSTPPLFEMRFRTR
jgi:hypothetical protein